MHATISLRRDSHSLREEDPRPEDTNASVSDGALRQPELTSGSVQNIRFQVFREVGVGKF